MFSRLSLFFTKKKKKKKERKKKSKILNLSYFFYNLSTKEDYDISCAVHVDYQDLHQYFSGD